MQIDVGTAPAAERSKSFRRGPAADGTGIGAGTFAAPGHAMHMVRRNAGFLPAGSHFPENAFMIKPY
jgi:hypothetical protein